ncbi:MAG: ComEA family DNA-binding protein [Clostridiaceae bacterium]|nr:ComEA family DNA-binding protein [Clostridiaceae bacterium]
MRGQERTDSYPVAGRRSGRPRRAPLLFFWVLITLSAALLILIARRPAGKAVVVIPKETETDVTKTPTLALFPVHVDGAVTRPGLYYFEEDSILGDAIAKAGGFTLQADQSAINLAMLLQAHMKIYVPREGEEATGISLDGIMMGAEVKVDLNRATRQELETLPGVGEATAEAIIAYREEHGPFADIEELMQVPGIKEGRFSKLKDRIRVTKP